MQGYSFHMYDSFFTRVVITHHVCEKNTTLLWKDIDQSLGSLTY